MGLQIAAVFFNRGIVGDGDTGSRGCQPCRKQPQVIPQLAGKRRRGVVMRPVGQRQVMLGIEEINVNHDVQRRQCRLLQNNYFTLMLTLDFMPVAGSLTVRVITPGFLSA